MLNRAFLESAESLVARLAAQIENVDIAPPSDRNRISAACFHLALEHHEAIVHLIRHNLSGSAFALIRPLFEGYVRGIWLGKCATELELCSFQKGILEKKFGELLSDVEKYNAYDDGILTEVKKNSWSAMCDFAHGGALQINRRITSDSIAANYKCEEIVEVLTFASAIGILLTAEVAVLAQQLHIVPKLHEEMKKLEFQKNRSPDVMK